MDEKIVVRLWRKYKSYVTDRTVKNAKAFWLGLINAGIDPIATPVPVEMTYIEFVTTLGMAATLETESTMEVTENVNA